MIFQYVNMILHYVIMILHYVMMILQKVMTILHILHITLHNIMMLLHYVMMTLLSGDTSLRYDDTLSLRESFIIRCRRGSIFFCLKQGGGEKGKGLKCFIYPLLMGMHTQKTYMHNSQPFFQR